MLKAYCDVSMGFGYLPVGNVIFCPRRAIERMNPPAHVLNGINSANNKSGNKAKRINEIYSNFVELIII